jgi:hypothetical protein
MSLIRRVVVLLRTHVLPHLGGDRRLARLAFIDSYRFPDAVRADFAAAHPELDAAAQMRVLEALRSFFGVHALAPGGIAGVPSRIVEDAWATFATDNCYGAFCDRAFGRFVEPVADSSQGAIAHTWAVSCARERIEPRRPSRLPSLFAIDRELRVRDGRYYALNESDSEMARRMLGVSALVMMAATLTAGETDAPDVWNGALADAHLIDALPGHAGDMAVVDAGDFGGGDFGGSS